MGSLKGPVQRVSLIFEFKTMKFNKQVTSSRRKNRKAYFNAPSHVRRTLMSAPCPKIFAKSMESDLCLSARMMKYKLSEDILKANKLAKYFRHTEKNMSSILRGFNAKKPMEQLYM